MTPRYYFFIITAILSLSLASAFNFPFLSQPETPAPVFNFPENVMENIVGDCPSGYAVYGINEDGTKNCIFLPIFENTWDGNYSSYVNLTRLFSYNYYNSSTLPSSSDTWFGNYSYYVNLTRLFTYGYWNTTDNAFNKTYADRIYAIIGNITNSSYATHSNVQGNSSPYYNYYNSTLINSTALEDQSGKLSIVYSYFKNQVNDLIGNFSFTGFYGLITGNRTAIEGEIAGNLTTAKTYTNNNMASNRTAIEGEIAGNLTTAKTYTDTNVNGNRTAINGLITGNYSQMAGTVNANRTAIETNLANNKTQWDSRTNSSYASLVYNNTGTLNVSSTISAGAFYSSGNVTINKSGYILFNGGTSYIFHNGSGLVIQG